MQPNCVQVRLNELPRLSVPYCCVIPRLLVVVEFQWLPSAAEPLVMVVLPKVLLVWFQLLPVCAFEPCTVVVLP